MIFESIDLVLLLIYSLKIRYSALIPIRFNLAAIYDRQIVFKLLRRIWLGITYCHLLSLRKLTGHPKWVFLRSRELLYSVCSFTFGEKLKSFSRFILFSIITICIVQILYLVKVLKYSRNEESVVVETN